MSPSTKGPIRGPSRGIIGGCKSSEGFDLRPCPLRGLSVRLPSVLDGYHLPGAREGRPSLSPKLIPTTFDWQNYTKALSTFPFVRGLTNTLIIALGVEVGQLISVPIAGYAFARLQFPGRRVLFGVLLGTLMLPYYVTIIPQYLIFRHLGWLNTYFPLTVPSFFGFGAAFFILMFRQFFLSIPKDYDDAAMIDGCGRLRVFWYVIVPQARPAIAVMAIFTFISSWNDYFGPLIYLTDPNKFTLALDFYTWQQAQNPLPPQPYNHVMAMATLITMVPLTIFSSRSGTSCVAWSSAASKADPNRSSSGQLTAGLVDAGCPMRRTRGLACGVTWERGGQWWSPGADKASGSPFSSVSLMTGMPLSASRSTRAWPTPCVYDLARPTR